MIVAMILESEMDTDPFVGYFEQVILTIESAGTPLSMSAP